MSDACISTRAVSRRLIDWAIWKDGSGTVEVSLHELDEIRPLEKGAGAVGLEPSVEGTWRSPDGEVKGKMHGIFRLCLG